MQICNLLPGTRVKPYECPQYECSPPAVRVPRAPPYPPQLPVILIAEGEKYHISATQPVMATQKIASRRRRLLLAETCHAKGLWRPCGPVYR